MKNWMIGLWAALRNEWGNLTGGEVALHFDDITHNPWAPSHKLTAEGKKKVKAELAVEIRNNLQRRYKRARSGIVTFDGEAYAGWTR